MTDGGLEVFGFLGPDGAGKSTTSRLLLGLARPTAGGPRCSAPTSPAPEYSERYLRSLGRNLPVSPIERFVYADRAHT